MNIALYEYLNGVAALTALVVSRIFPLIAPQSATFPRITYTRIANPRARHMLASSGLSLATYQLDSWALTTISVTLVSEALREALDGYIGKTMGTSAPVKVSEIRLIDEDDSKEDPVDASDEAVFRVRQEYMITHRESIPTP